MTTVAPAPVPLVSYLALDPPRLVASACRACGARFFDRRMACAACGSAAGFTPVDVATTGTVRAFTIVAVAAPGTPVPYVAVLVDCAGTSVRGLLVTTPPDPDHVRLGMAVRLTTVPIGRDADGVEAIGYAFTPGEGTT